jgi:hypothetical protein
MANDGEDVPRFFAGNPSDGEAEGEAEGDGENWLEDTSHPRAKLETNSKFQNAAGAFVLFRILNSAFCIILHLPFSALTLVP